jgi:hypothetical protein
VVARKSSICYDAVERRKMKKEKKDKIIKYENNQKYDKIKISKNHEKQLLFP